MTKRSSFHLAVRPEHDIRVRGSLALVVFALAACSGVDEPGSRACEPPNVLRYEKPGCGDLASPVCGSPQSDAHLTYACGCDGEVVLGGDYYREPWQSPGLCPGTCYTPTRNLEAAVSLSGLVHGCACDSGTDATACVEIFGGYRPMACVAGTWTLDDTGAPCTSRDAGLDGKPADAGLDGKPTDAGCLPPRSIIYTTPGCGAEAIPRCEVPNGDGCSMMVCLCDGVTTSGDGCAFSPEPFLYVGWCKRDAAPAVDVPMSVDLSNEPPPVVDAGSCTGEAADLQRQYYVEPCPLSFDTGVSALSCYGYIGARISKAECGQRQTLSWSWGTHGMTCHYEGGALVGLSMHNDTPAFCQDTSRSLEVGDVDACPSSAQTLLFFCNPFSDGGYLPYSPG